MKFSVRLQSVLKYQKKKKGLKFLTKKPIPASSIRKLNAFVDIDIKCKWAIMEIARRDNCARIQTCRRQQKILLVSSQRQSLIAWWSWVLYRNWSRGCGWNCEGCFGTFFAVDEGAKAKGWRHFFELLEGWSLTVTESILVSILCPVMALIFRVSMLFADKTVTVVALKEWFVR